MPRKHRRTNLKTSSSSSSSYNLPPSQIAHPLPTTTRSSSFSLSQKHKSKSLQRSNAQNDYKIDDTPRAFTRLLGSYRPPRSGLDDGNPRPHKNRKTAAPSESIPPSSTVVPSHSELVPDVPKRQHGESLPAFAARVDAMMPLSGVQKKSKGAAMEMKGLERQTRTERKMQKMYQEWREEDRRLREKAVEELEGKEGDVIDDEELVRGMGVDENVRSGIGRKGNKKRGRTGGGGRSSDEDDPWAKIAAKRNEAEGNGGLVGLHDVVQAPPRFTKVPRRGEKMKAGSGGLKRQSELSEARQSVVEGYRQMMQDRRARVA